MEIEGYDIVAELVIDHCHFTNCEGTVISADGNQFGDTFKITVQNCLVDNHEGNFLMARYADRGYNTGVEIKHSTFNNIVGYAQAENRDFRNKNFLSLIYVADVTFSCEKNVFSKVQEGVLDTNSSCACSQKSSITHCEFIDCQYANPLTGEIIECTFDNAQLIRFGNCLESLNREVLVTKSIFRNINGRVTLEYGKIEHCNFVDSTVKVEITGKSIGKDTYISESNDLNFTNCTAPTNKGYSFVDPPCFLQAVSYLDKPGLCVMFNGCKFENCHTTGNYINTGKKVFGAFDRVKVITVGRENNTRVN